VGTRGEDASAGGGGADARETAMAANDRAAVATKDGAAAAANDGAAVAAPGVIADERVAAADLARFVREIRGVPVTADAPRGGRAPLRELDGVTRDAIAHSRDVIDVDAALVAWERALIAPPHTGPPVWIHGDLLRPNLLVHAGRLSAVLDFGAAGVGDPAADLVAAWAVFTAPGRERFREALDVDDGTWARARGYALHQAALIIPYYAETNPEFVAHARRTVEQVLGDLPQREAGCLPTVRLLR
jgi:aminoglycoside phosphotransferase (APT) family kinase protein